jgi:hypothetical protein
MAHIEFNPPLQPQALWEDGLQLRPRGAAPRHRVADQPRPLYMAPQVIGCRATANILVCPSSVGSQTSVGSVMHGSVSSARPTKVASISHFIEAPPTTVTWSPEDGLVKLYKLDKGVVASLALPTDQGGAFAADAIDL